MDGDKQCSNDEVYRMKLLSYIPGKGSRLGFQFSVYYAQAFVNKNSEPHESTYKFVIYIVIFSKYLSMRNLLREVQVGSQSVFSLFLFGKESENDTKYWRKSKTQLN